MRRIIHLSDLHVGAEEIEGRFRTFLDSLIHSRGDRAGEYVLVITGDMVDNASHGQHADEVSQGLAELGRAGFDQILVVPGNHDYGDGSDGDARFVEPFKLRYFGTALSYPKVDVVEGVAFLGLDSMAEELHWYDHLFAEGELGELQLQRLAGALRRDDVRSAEKRVVYLHHHPFDSYPFHGLKDASGLRRVLEDAAAAGSAVDALLYGHNHLGKDRNGEWGIPRCYDAGSATLEPGLKVARALGIHQTQACTREIDLERDASSDAVLELV
jgi:3',5'-cyclic AMP phosphodiesterase CpdA